MFAGTADIDARVYGRRINSLTGSQRGGDIAATLWKVAYGKNNISGLPGKDTFASGNADGAGSPTWN